MNIILLASACAVAGLVVAFLLRARAGGRIALAAGVAALVGNGLQVGFC